MKKCKECLGEFRCDEHFLEDADGQVNLGDTIRALAKALSPENRKKFLAMPFERQRWIAVEAWVDGLVRFTGKVGAR